MNDKKPVQASPKPASKPENPTARELAEAMFRVADRKAGIKTDHSMQTIAKP